MIQFETTFEREDIDFTSADFMKKLTPDWLDICSFLPRMCTLYLLYTTNLRGKFHQVQKYQCYVSVT